MAASIVSLLAPSLVAGSAAYLAATAFTHLALSYALSSVFGPETPATVPDEGVSARIPSNPGNKLPIVYGERRIAGSITMADISSNNQKMAFIISLANGPVEGITEVKWQDKTLSFGSALSSTLQNVTDATDADGNSDDFLNSGRMKVAVFPEGGRCPQMEDFSSKWKDYTGAQDLTNTTQTNRQMPGVAYVYVELTYDRAKRVTGLPNNVQFLMKGRKVKTLSTGGVLSSTETYSTNPAECLLDYLTNTTYGANIPVSTVDLESFFSHKTFCDVSKAYTDNKSVAASAKRFTTNGVINTNQVINRNIFDMTVGNSASFNWNLGQFAIITNKERSSTHSFDVKNIYGGIDVAGTGFDSKLNKLTMLFSSKEEQEQEAQVVLNTPASNMNSNEPVLEQTLGLPMTNNNIESERIGAIILNQSRQNLVVKFETDLGALQVQAGDVISITHITPDWNEKKFRVTSVEEITTNGAVGLRILAQEYADAVYEDRSINEFDVAPNTNFPDPYASPVVSIDSIAENTSIPESNLVVNWTDTNAVFNNDYIIGYRLNVNVADPLTFKTVSGGTKYVISGLEPLQTYYIQIQPVSTLGVEGSVVSSTGTTGASRAVGTPGAPGTAGRFSQCVYLRSSEMPTTPTDGSYDIVSDVLAPPTGWALTDPGTPDGVGTWETCANINPSATEGGEAETGFFDISGVPGTSTAAQREVRDLEFSGTTGTYTVTSPGTAETNTISAVGARTGSDASSSGFQETSDITFSGVSSTFQAAHASDIPLWGNQYDASGDTDGSQTATEYFELGGTSYLISRVGVYSITSTGVTTLVSTPTDIGRTISVATDGTTVAFTTLDSKIYYSTDAVNWTEGQTLTNLRGAISYVNNVWIMARTSNRIYTTSDITSSTTFTSTDVGFEYFGASGYDGTRFILKGFSSPSYRIFYSTSITSTSWTELGTGNDFVIDGDNFTYVDNRDVKYSTTGITGTFSTNSGVFEDPSKNIILSNGYYVAMDGISATSQLYYTEDVSGTWITSSEEFYDTSTYKAFGTVLVVNVYSYGVEILTPVAIVAGTGVASTVVTINPFGIGDTTVTLNDASTATETATQVRTALNATTPTAYTVKAGTTALVELEYDAVGDLTDTVVSETTPTGSTLDSSVDTVNGAPVRVANNSIEETDITLTGASSNSELIDITNINGAFQSQASFDFTLSSDSVNYSLRIRGYAGGAVHDGSPNFLFQPSDQGLGYATDLVNFINANSTIISATYVSDTHVRLFITNLSSVSNIQTTGGPTVTLNSTSYSLTLDSRHSSTPITGLFGSGLDGAGMATQLRSDLNAAITAGTLTDVLVKTGSNNVVELDTSTGGPRLDATIVITNTGNGNATSAVNVHSQGGQNDLDRTSYTMSVASANHNPSSVSGTFPNHSTSTEVANILRNHFVNNDFGGFSVTVIANDSFVATSNFLGNEDPNLTVSITTDGTDNDVEISNAIVNGTDRVTSGTPTTWTIVTPNATYTRDFSSNIGSESAEAEIGTFLSATGFYTTSVVGSRLRITDVIPGVTTSRIVASITTSGTSATMTQPVNTLITLGAAAISQIDAITLNFNSLDQIMYEFPSGQTTSQAADLIAANVTNSQIVFEHLNSFASGITLPSGDQRIKWTYQQNGSVPNNVIGNLVVNTGDTSGTLQFTALLTTTEGGSSAALGDWSTPLEITGQRGAGEYSGAITLATGESVPAVDSATFAANALATYRSVLGIADAIPEAGDVVTVVYTDSNGNVTVRTARNDGQGVAAANWTIFEQVIDGNLLVNGSVNGTKIEAGTVNGDRITAGTIQADEIAANAITLGKIPLGELTTTAVGSVTGTNAGSVGDAKVIVPSNSTTITVPANATISMIGSFVLGGSSTQFIATPSLNVIPSTDVTVSGFVSYNSFSGGNITNPFVGRVTTGDTPTELSVDMEYSGLDGDDRQLLAIFSYTINRR